MNYLTRESQNNPLFIFTHIPKTAGEVFKRNIENSLCQNQVIRTSFNHRERFYNILSGQHEYYKDKNHFKSIMLSLSQNHIDNIKILCGHDSYYGIHALLNRDAKYITFIRDPLKRTISMYNYKRLVWEVHSTMRQPLDPRQTNALDYMKKYFLINGKIPTFEAWLECHYDKSLPIYATMTNYLRSLGFFDSNCSTDFDNALDKFYFIGTSDTYESDSHYLYHKLGVNYFYSDKNGSMPHVTINSLSKTMIDKILYYNREDTELFNRAIIYNKRFKNAHKQFYILFKTSQFKKSILRYKTKLKSLCFYFKMYLKQSLRRYLK